MLTSEAGAYRCNKCGRVIGSYENGLIVIRHKGRIVRIKPINGACEVQIVCEKPNCNANNVIVLAEPNNETVELLDKIALSRT